MSYDIYGNLLHRGHCEVHPYIREEYPCSVCMQESNNRNAHKQSESDHYEIMRLEHELELSQQRIEELEQRVQELENTIGQSLGNMEYAAFNLCENTDLSTRSKNRVVESTCPETSLLIAIRDLKEVLQTPKEQSK